MDESMTSEVVKLMLDELERVRCRNRELLNEIQAANTSRLSHARESVDSNVSALQQENGSLKAEVEAARIRLDKLLGHDRDADEGLDISKEGKGTAEGLAGPSNAPGAAEVELADRVERARERYKRHKSSKYDLEETILETQNKIDETTAEYERELQKRQEELLQLDTLASEAQNTLGATETPQFDLVDFLYNPMSDTDGAELLEEDVLAPSMFANATALPNAIAKLCSPHGFAMRRSGEVVWPSDPPSRAHCLFFSSTHHYDPKAHNSKGGWAPVWDMRAHTDKTKEVFYLKAQKWFYAGTYECQKRSILPFSDISVLEKQHKHDLQQRTVLNSDMVAPMLVKMIRDMYECGALKIVCTGWCRVGFNDKLADALRSLGDTTTVPGRATHRPYPSGARIQVLPEGSRSGKRPHEDVDTAPRKKHKT